MLNRRTENTQVLWQHQPSTVPHEKRFDEDALEEILATAAYLQKAEQNTLSQAEVESIAAEMGLSSQHVRQAILLAGQPTARMHRLPYAGLSVKQKQLVASTTLVYAVLTLLTGFAVEITRVHDSGWNALAYSLYFLTLLTLPFAIIWLGTQLHYKRAGAAVGGFVLLVMYLSALVPSMLSSDLLYKLEPYMVWNGVMIGCAYVTAGVVFGSCGAALHQWLSGRRLRYAPPAKPSDFDR